MDIDQQHCPHCGHDVLGWDLVCPGCNVRPWETPEARQLVLQLAWRQQWRKVGWVVAGLGAYAGLVALLQLYGHRSEATPEGQGRRADTFMRECQAQRQALFDASDESTERRRLTAKAEAWVDTSLPRLLRFVEDDATAPESRVEMITALTCALEPSQDLSVFVEPYRERAIRTFTRLMTHDAPSVKSAAMGALLDMEQAAALPPAQTLLFSADPEVRLVGVRAMYTQVRSAGTTKEQQTAALNLLAELLHDIRREVQEAAANALIALDDARVAPWLIQQFDSVSPERRTRAAHALELLTNQRFGLDQNEWINWWNQHHGEPLHRRKDVFIYF